MLSKPFLTKGLQLRIPDQVGLVEVHSGKAPNPKVALQVHLLCVAHCFGGFIFTLFHVTLLETRIFMNNLELLCTCFKMETLHCGVLHTSLMGCFKDQAKKGWLNWDFFRLEFIVVSIIPWRQIAQRKLTRLSDSFEKPYHAYFLLFLCLFLTTLYYPN